MCYVLSHIIGRRVPVNPKLMLLLDMDYFQLQSYSMLLADLLTAATLLLVKMWKLQTVPDPEEWLSRVRHLWLLSKLSALYRYRARVEKAVKNFECYSKVSK